MLCLLVSLLSFFTVQAEHIQYGDYTDASAGFFDGDLVIIGGNLDINKSFTINGDLKIISGKVNVVNDTAGTSTTDLYVEGDLIVTNTESSGKKRLFIFLRDTCLCVERFLRTVMKMKHT